MTYAIQSDLEARLATDVLVSLADEDADEAADPAIVGAALGDASARIDQMLAARYVTPVDPAPEVLRRWCVDLAVEGLFLRKKKALPPEHAGHAVATRNELEAIADGQNALAGAQPRLEAFETNNSRLDEAATFTRETLEAF